MSVIRFRKDDGVETHIAGAGGWEDFESIVAYLRKSFDAVVSERMDEVFTRNWILTIGNESVVLRHHEDFGNFFWCEDDETELVARIASELAKRLA